MKKATRLQYLQAMGIDVWIPRVSSKGGAEQSETAGQAVVKEGFVKKDIVKGY